MRRQYTQEEVEQLMLPIINIYVNPDDLNVFVRKRGRRSSWTLNLGNKWSWMIIGAIILAVRLALFTQEYIL